jgi:hypothetical protein
MSYPPVRSSEPSERRTLSIRVLGGGDDERRTLPLRAGLSIGSDARNPIVISHPEVRPVHATVWPLQDVLRLECAEGAVAVLSDGTEVTRLILTEGTRCRIGDALLICLDSEAGLLDEAAGDAICGRCGLDVRALPQSRRFCPRCGFKLAGEAAEPAVVTYRHPLPVMPLERQQEPSHSLMVSGYATAMNKLGVRYEVGHGVARNEDEAIRCFGKAARLGNEDARTRLAHWDDADVSPAED